MKTKSKIMTYKSKPNLKYISSFFYDDVELILDKKLNSIKRSELLLKTLAGKSTQIRFNNNYCILAI